MKVDVQWVKGRSFMGSTGSGHGIVMDTAAEHGGSNLGPRPMEMMLLGLGGCTGIDVVMMLEKMREKVTGFSVSLDGERAGEDPKVFTHVTLHYTLRGKGLKEANVERAIKLSAEKYCSASKMFEKTARIDHAWTIIED